MVPLLALLGAGNGTILSIFASEERNPWKKRPRYAVAGRSEQGTIKSWNRSTNRSILEGYRSNCQMKRKLLALAVLAALATPVCADYLVIRINLSPEAQQSSG